MKSAVDDGRITGNLYQLLLQDQELQKNYLKVIATIDEYKKWIKKSIDEGKTEEEVTNKLYAESDKLLEEHIERINKTDRPISCKKGCSFCCHIQVDISKTEAKMIINHAKKNNIDLNIKRLTKQAMIENVSEYVLNPDRQCVFLSDQGECKIYEARPFSCRKYLVVGDPNDCNTYTNGFGGVLGSADVKVEILATAMLQMDNKNGCMPKLLLNEIMGYEAYEIVPMTEPIELG